MNSIVFAYLAKLVTTVKKSIFTLKKIIDEYEKINSQSIDNISKQTEFSKYINKRLKSITKLLIYTDYIILKTF